MKPSEILEASLRRNRRDGWVPRMHGDYNNPCDTRCCIMVAMCRALRPAGLGDLLSGSFMKEEAVEARQAMRDVLGIEEIAHWNDTRHDFREVEEGVMRTVRVLRARGR